MPHDLTVTLGPLVLCLLAAGFLVALTVPAVRARHRTRTRRTAIVSLRDGTVLRGAISRRARHVVLDDAELLEGPPPLQSRFARGATTIIGAGRVLCVAHTDPAAPYRAAPTATP